MHYQPFFNCSWIQSWQESQESADFTVTKQVEIAIRMISRIWRDCCGRVPLGSLFAWKSLKLKLSDSVVIAFFFMCLCIQCCLASYPHEVNAGWHKPKSLKRELLTANAWCSNRDTSGKAPSDFWAWIMHSVSIKDNNHLHRTHETTTGKYFHNACVTSRNDYVTGPIQKLIHRTLRSFDRSLDQHQIE